LGFLDLIPILGYFFLLGKCRYCQAPISWRYPLVELVTGALFVTVALFFPNPLELVFCLFFMAILIVIFFVDLEHQVIPDMMSLGGIGLGLVFNFSKSFFYKGQGGNPFISALIGMFLGWAIFYLIGKLGKWVFKKDAIGEGDLYLAAMLGAFLGWPEMLLAVFLSYLFAGIVALVFLALGKIKMGEYIPFGPALVVGGILTLFFSQQIINWYLNVVL